MSTATETGGRMTTYRIERDGELDLSFDGELLADLSSRDSDEQDRWTEIRIYRTTTGKYVTEVIGRSVMDGEHDRIDVQVHHRAEDVPDGLRRTRKNYLTKLVLDALDDAATQDPALRAANVENI